MARTWTIDDKAQAHCLRKQEEDRTWPQPIVTEIVRSRDKLSLIISRSLHRKLTKGGIRMNDNSKTMQQTENVQTMVLSHFEGSRWTEVTQWPLSSHTSLTMTDFMTQVCVFVLSCWLFCCCCCYFWGDGALLILQQQKSIPTFPQPNINDTSISMTAATAPSQCVLMRTLTVLIMEQDNIHLLTTHWWAVDAEEAGQVEAASVLIICFWSGWSSRQ